MTVKNSKANADLEYFLGRIDEIRMSDLDRMHAKARFQRAEAIAEAFAVAGKAMARLFARLTSGTRHGSGRPASTTG